MKSILIYNNPELFTALLQTKVMLPECNINSLSEIKLDTLKDITVFIANHSDINKFEDKLKNIRTNIICLGNNGDACTLAKAQIINKPYRLQEIITAIHNIISAGITNEITIRIENFDFTPATRTLLNGNKIISLTEKESALLMLLYNAENKTISREEILKEVWGYEDGVDTHTIETHIYRIRQKIGKSNDFIGSSSSGYFLKSKNQ